jgi:hypothetical protein
MNANLQNKSIQRNGTGEDIRYSPRVLSDLKKMVIPHPIIKASPVPNPVEILKFPKSPQKTVNERFRYHLLCPENLMPILDEIEKNPPDLPAFRMAYLREIIYLICAHEREDGYSYLLMKLVSKLIPGEEHYFKYLLGRGWIERTSNYKPGAKSYGYRFVEKFRSKYIGYPLNDARLIRRIEKCKPAARRWGYSIQNEFIENIKIAPAAWDFIEKHYTEDNYNYAIGCLTRIQNGEWKHNFDETAGRYHSNITNMPKDLRRFIEIYGQRITTNIDIKNSQPYFIILLLTNPGKIAHLAKDKYLRMFLESLQISDSEDIKRYITLVTAGKLYEYLWKQFKARGLHFESRDGVKKVVMQILFDYNSHMPIARQIFAELFPVVHEIFNRLRGSKKGDKFESFKRFSILLQSIEAEVMLKKIYPRIIKELPEVVALTVHDSILCTAGVNRIFAIMNEELKAYVGYTPILKIETFAAFGSSTLGIIAIERGKGEREGEKGSIVL